MVTCQSSEFGWEVTIELPADFLSLGRGSVTPGVITGNFALYNTEIHALIDPGSTHSYICIEQLSDKLPSVDPLAYDMLVTSPSVHSVRVIRVTIGYVGINKIYT